MSNFPLSDFLRLAIIDDHPVICEGFRSMLASWPHGSVVVLASNGIDYEQQMMRCDAVHIALVDLNMPQRDGYATIAWIKTHQPGTIPVAITFDASPEVVRMAIRYGAHGVLSKSADGNAVYSALDKVRLTGYCIDAVLLAQLTADRSSAEPAEEMPHPKIEAAITKREREFLDHLAAPDDPSYSTIAERMRISKHTVESFRRSLFEKLGVNNRQGLFRAALNWKLIRRTGGV